MASGPLVLARRALVSASVLWAGALPAAAMAAAQRHPSVAAYGFSAAVYAIGSLICHQLPERSFHVWGRQLPVCARCAGIYAGAAVAAVAALIVVRPGSPDRGSPLALVLAASAPAAATLIFEWSTGITPGNLTRALTGVMMGAAAGWVVIRSLEADQSAAPARPAHAKR